MDRHRTEKRRKAPRSVLRTVWIPAFTAIFVLYMVFVFKVNYYATTTTANSVGAAGPTGFLRDGGKAQPAVPGREMQEKGGIAPEPELAQAATKPAAPTRPEMKRPSQKPEPIAGAITKAPPTATAPSVTEPATTAAPPQTRAAAPVTTTTPPTSAPVQTTPPPQTTAPPQTTVPAQTEAAAPAPIDVTTAIETAKPIEAPVIKDLTQAPATRGAAPLASTTVIQQNPVNTQHVKLSGYRQLMDHLATYKPVPGESLFLYFACSDDKFQPHDWASECTDASKTVYDVFSKSPLTNRLVTIYAGSERFWEYQNKFRNDRDLRVKTVPSIMKWHGYRGETSGMMITDTLAEEPFVRYLFKNTDQPDVYLNAAAMVNTKTIETVSSYEAYQAKLEAYKLEPKPRHPLYLLFVSGRMAENNRPWCPYCRFSELPMEYGFYAFAPPNARLLRVEVAATYPEWKTPNKYNQDPSLGPLRGVPAFFTMQQLANEELKFDRLYERFDNIAAIKNLYATASRVHDE